MAPRSLVSPKGQVTLPISARRMLGIKPGDTVEFEVGEGSIVVKPVGSALDAIHRSVPALREKLSVKEMVRRAAEEHAEQVAREDLP
jgi:AbrB family looped-hinge helix DNA binding protein